MKALIIARQALGKIWGLKPGMVHWLHTVAIRPIVTYGCIVWWLTLESLRALLNIEQRVHCLCTTSVMLSSPIAAMETLINFVHLGILVLG